MTMAELRAGAPKSLWKRSSQLAAQLGGDFSPFWVGVPPRGAAEPHPVPLAGHGPHVPAEVPLPPRHQPALHQAEDAAARVHHQALRGEGDLPGAGPLILQQGGEGQPWGASSSPTPSGFWPGAPRPPCRAPHREVLLRARCTSFWIRITTRSARTCWICSSAAGPR